PSTRLYRCHCPFGCSVLVPRRRRRRRRQRRRRHAAMATQRRSVDKHEVEVLGHRPSTDAHLEKVPEAIDVNGFRVFGLSPEDADFYTNYPPEKRKKVFHKVDVRLVPMLALLYLICHIDRANIGNAKIEGMVEDLGMTGVQYNTVLSIFFVPYVLFEVPSNIVLKRFKRPSHYLGGLTLAWGIVMTCTGLHSVEGRVAERSRSGEVGPPRGFRKARRREALAGRSYRQHGHFMVSPPLNIDQKRNKALTLDNPPRAGFFPGAIYLTSFWYEPKDLSTRISYFYCASAMSGAFSGLLAAGIAEMDGVSGLEGWRWIFILEGIATICIGVSCFFLLVDTPALSKRWLEPEEIRYLELSIFIKQGGGSREESG
ncbi:putative transporter, partial [Colletotrichum tanaceti]